jgi:hypothetical protein
MTVHHFPGSRSPQLPIRTQHGGNDGGNDGGDGVEARIAKLESDVGHIRETTGDVKIDLRRLADKVGGVKDELHSAKIWAITLYVGLAVGLFSFLYKIFEKLPG